MNFDPESGELTTNSRIIFPCAGCDARSEDVEFPDGNFAGDGDCKMCHGKGEVQIVDGFKVCPRCKGSCVCSGCKGTGVVTL